MLSPEKRPMLCPFTHTEPDDSPLVLSPTVTNAPACGGFLKVVLQNDGRFAVALLPQSLLRNFAQFVTLPIRAVSSISPRPPRKRQVVARGSPPLFVTPPQIPAPESGTGLPIGMVSIPLCHARIAIEFPPSIAVNVPL